MANAMQSVTTSQLVCSYVLKAVHKLLASQCFCLQDSCAWDASCSHRCSRRCLLLHSPTSLPATSHHHHIFSNLVKVCGSRQPLLFCSPVGIDKLQFQPNGDISGMVSAEGELVPLKTRIKPSTVGGAVEKWLIQVPSWLTPHECLLAQRFTSQLSFTHECNAKQCTCVTLQNSLHAFTKV